MRNYRGSRLKINIFSGKFLMENADFGFVAKCIGIGVLILLTFHGLAILIHAIK